MKKKNSVIFFVLLGLYIGENAHAKYYATPESQCSAVDFRNSFPMKIRDQKKLSWCYAHAAADYLQYTFSIPEQISAADIAIHYSKSNWSKLVTFFRRMSDRSTRAEPPQTGLIKVAIQKTLSQGYCPENLLPSDEWTRVTKSNQEKAKVEILQSILDTYALQKDIHAGKYKNAEDLPYYFSFKNITQNNFFHILKNSSRKSVLLRIRDAACSGERKPYPEQALKLNFNLRGSHIFQSMNSGFNADMPVTIDFFSTVLKNYDSFKKEFSSLHTVLMYGRRFDRTLNECIYLMRDSHGTSCKGYDPKISCEEGYLWLAESKLYPALTSRLVIRKLE